MDINTKLILIDRLVPDADYYVVDGTDIIWNDDRDMPTDTDLEAELIKYNDEVKKDLYYQKLNKFVDDKTYEAMKIVLEKEPTEDLLRRYETKYEMAQAYLADGSYADELSMEAELVGMTVDDLAKLIVDRGDQFKEMLKQLTALLEAFRVKTSYLIDDGEYVAVDNIIVAAYELNPVTSTYDDLKTLFDTYAPSDDSSS